MPVEFECPHCNATVRAPDEVMGRTSGCTSCRELLRVPTVEIPRTAVADTELFDRKAIAEQLDRRAAAGVAGDPSASSMESATFAPAPFDPAAAPPAASARKPYKRRKRGNGGWWALLGVVAVITLAYGGYRVLTSVGAPVTGTLTGTVAAAPDLSRTLTLPAGTGADSLLGLLDEAPVAIEGPTYRLEMTAAGDDSRDVSVAYVPGEDGRVVQADLNAHPAAAAYLRDNAARLRGRVQRAIRDETAAFASSDVDRGSAGRFLERTAALAHVDGLGAFVLGGAGSVGYPVVAEPEPGVLLFVVPESLKRLELLPSTGRGDALPREFYFDVRLP